MSKLILPMYKNDMFFMEFGEYHQVSTHNVQANKKSNSKSRNKNVILKHYIKNHEVQH